MTKIKYQLWARISYIVNKLKRTTCDKCKWCCGCGCVGGMPRYIECCRGFWNHSFEPKNK